jgi:hypothetical protein
MATRKMDAWNVESFPDTYSDCSLPSIERVQEEAARSLADVAMTGRDTRRQSKSVTTMARCYR